MTQSLELESIRTDGGTQPRAYLNELVISEYVETMAEGATFPPLVVFHDGSHYWLADGFHRFFAAKKQGAQSLSADVRTGTRREAILFAAGANATHGLRRTNADKRRAAKLLLDDDEWRRWSDREIARQCGVTHTFVGKLRKSLQGTGDEGPLPATPRAEAMSALAAADVEDRAPDASDFFNEASESGGFEAYEEERREPGERAYDTRPAPERMFSSDDDLTGSSLPLSPFAEQPRPPEPSRGAKPALADIATASRQTPDEWVADMLVNWLLDLERAYDGVTLSLVQQAAALLVPQYQRARQEIVEP